MRALFFPLVLAVAAGATPAAAALPASVDGKPLPSLSPMLDSVTPGVVNIATRGRVKMRNNPLFDDPFFRHFFDLPQRPPERYTQSLGSGVIVDADNGYILTNHHVVARAEQIRVGLRDGRELDAKLIGSDPDSDVAVIQVEADNLTAVPWGDSDRLSVGDFVVAIGNPFGLGQTVTSGIVSALQRSGLGIEAYEDFIQTDASINPGNSGGALVDLNGNLVGINTAIVGPSGGNVGIGFAIPANMARQIMKQLIDHGEVRRGQLGIAIQNIDRELAEAFDLERDNGVIVSRVESDSPAEKAGLRAGDIIVEVDGRTIRNAADMRTVIGLQPIGEVLRMKVIRDGEPVSVKAVIEEHSAATIDGEELHPRLGGARLAPASAVTDRRDVSGLAVTELAPGSPAASAGLRPGDIIASINRKPVDSIETAKRLAERSRDGLLLNIRRGDKGLFMVLR